MKATDWLTVIRYLSLVSGIGLSFVIPVILGWWLGGLLQSRLTWDGWFLLFLLLGVVVGAANGYYLLKQVVSRERG